MGTRKLSMRQLRWQAARRLTRLVPALRGPLTFYEETVSAYDIASADRRERRETHHFTAYERALIECLPPDVPHQSVPETLERTTALLRLEDVTLLGDTGRIFKEDKGRGRLVTFMGHSGPVSMHDTRPALLRTRDVPDAPYFNMLGSWKGHEHLFHFLFDRAPRLHYLLSDFGLGEAPVKVLVNQGLPPFQQDFYRFLTARHPNLEIVTVPAGERWRLPRLYHLDVYLNTISTLADPEVLSFLRRLFVDGYSVQAPQQRRRLWISRNDTKNRRILNEDALQPVLEKHGFETVLAGNLPFAEQVATFAQTEAVAGTHGAGLTNLLFAPPGTRVLELFPSNKLRNTYFLQSRSQGLPYRYLIAGPGSEREHYRVDPKALDAELALLLEGI